MGCPVCETTLIMNSTVKDFDDYDYHYICPSCLWQEEGEEGEEEEELPF